MGLRCSREQEDATVKAFVSANDVQMALSQINAGSTEEIESTVEANGEGGRIRLHFVRRDVQRMHYEVLKNGWLFGGACVFVIGLYYHALNHGYVGFLLFPVGFIVFGILAGLWNAFHDSKKDLEEYERKQAARFAES